MTLGLLNSLLRYCSIEKDETGAKLIKFIKQYDFPLFGILLTLVFITSCKQASVTEVSNPSTSSQNHFDAPVRLNARKTPQNTQGFTLTTQINDASARRAIEITVSIRRLELVHLSMLWPI